jgi:hypothetical protein
MTPRAGRGHRDAHHPEPRAAGGVPAGPRGRA